MRRLAFVALIPLITLSPRALAEAPTGYWADAAGLEGDALRVAVHGIIDDHAVIPYEASGFDVHDAIDLLDEAPQDPTSVILVYNDAIAAKESWPGYNREHLWPQSLGAAEGTDAHSDLHHIRACDANVNSARSNRAYDTCETDCQTHVEAPDAPYNDATFEPPDHHKGDIARALFYMDVRYEGGVDPDLTLGDAAPVKGCDCMGRLSELLAWHVLDPVDETERARHEGVYTLQGNRNPFVDHPEWACSLWPDALCEGVVDPGDGEDVGAPLPSLSGPPWINEIHYDNEGADSGEGVEIAGPAGMSLSGWQVALYNGNNGSHYGTITLAGAIDAEELGGGALWFDYEGVQNGPADGAALVAPGGEIVEFWSWEGRVTAADGPAAGRVSDDIGFVQDGLAGDDVSLQRVGEGREAADFTWVEPAAASRGALNIGQHIAEDPNGVGQTPAPTDTPPPTMTEGQSTPTAQAPTMTPSPSVAPSTPPPLETATPTMWVTPDEEPPPPECAIASSGEGVRLEALLFLAVVAGVRRRRSRA